MMCYAYVRDFFVRTGDQGVGATRPLCWADPRLPLLTSACPQILYGVLAPEKDKLLQLL